MPVQASAAGVLSWLNTTFRNTQLRPLLTLCSVPSSIAALHRGPKAFLCLSIPVATFQFKKYRSIGNAHGGLDQQHTEHLADAVQPGNNLLVGQDAHVLSFQKLFELPAVSSNTAGVGLRNEIQFLVGVNGWLDVLGFAQKRKRRGEHSRLFSIGDDGFHATARLGWIRRIGDDDPITMAVERQPVFEGVFPFCAHFEISSSSEQTATLPHFPEAIRA